MVGHSKWSKVKRIEGPFEVKRGAAVSKLVQGITVAARGGGGSDHPRRRSFVETAHTQNMPKPSGAHAHHGIQYVYSNFDLARLAG